MPRYQRRAKDVQIRAVLDVILDVMNAVAQLSENGRQVCHQQGSRATVSLVEVADYLATHSTPTGILAHAESAGEVL